MKNRDAHPAGLACVVLLLFPASGLRAQVPAKASSQVQNSVPSEATSITQPEMRNASKAPSDSFIIGNDDVLVVHVWKEPDVSRTLPVRSDGRISLPLVGEVQAAGRTPIELEAEIADKLQKYITDPQVTVIVQEIKSEKFNILGQVAKPGAYSLTRETTVLDAIAMAGGFRDFAKQKAIYILRQKAGGSELRIPFNYKDVIKGKSAGQNIKLEPRDTVVVP
jgi:polysaccharide export outer membrane protein